MLGQLTGALITGAVNAVVGGALVLGLFRRDLSRRARRLLLTANICVLALLASAAVLVDDFERAARHALYGPDVRVAVHTDVQEVLLTGGRDGRPLNLFLDGRLRVGGRDELRYHEALVHPAMTGRHARVLVLGGGDGLAAREVLRHPGVGRVDVVELDAGVVRLARTDPALSRLNAHSLDDPRVHVVTADAFDWLRTAPAGVYDVVVSDLPHPGITASTKLYAQEFYGLARQVLAPGGRLVVHGGAVESRARDFWTLDATLRAAGLRTTAYRVRGRQSGYAAGPDRGPADTARAHRDWGFVLAADRHTPWPRLDPAGPRPRTLTDASLAADVRAAERTRVPGLPPSTLVHPGTATDAPRLLADGGAVRRGVGRLRTHGARGVRSGRGAAAQGGAGRPRGSPGRCPGSSTTPVRNPSPGG